MKTLHLVILVNFMLINTCIGQSNINSDFFEFGIRKSKFLESNFLESSKYKSQLNDPSVEDMGFIPSATGSNYAAKLRYGKTISRKAYLISELSFTKRAEQVICFCHACDKYVAPSTLVNIYSFDVGVGGRYEIINYRNFNFFLEGIGNVSLASSESSAGYFGYSIHPIIQYKLMRRLNINLKYGFEQSFGKYEKKERYIELGFNLTIKQ